MKHPIRYGRDHGEKITMGEIVEAVADAVDLADLDLAVDELDRLFLDGVWGCELDVGRDPRLVLLRKDVRGLAIGCYLEGLRRGNQSRGRER